MEILNKIPSNTVIANLIIAFILGFAAIKLNDYIFRRIDRNSKRIHIKFFFRFTKGVIIIFALIFAINGFNGLDKLYAFAFGSSVVFTAVLGIIGKDALEDVLAGIMISIYRPFNTGDRVLITDIDKPCVVDDMTARHVVLRTMDNICYIIPNSEINDKIILNTSYHHGNLRGTFLKFEISYSSDIRLAIHLIREAVKNCPLTLPNNEKNADLDGYGDVYLMAITGNSYQLETTIWTENDTDNFLACSEVRIAVIEKFNENGIEIPYQYLNLIQKNAIEEIPSQNEIPDDIGKRNVKIRTDRIELRNYEADIEECFTKADLYSSYYTLSKADALKLRLITEELIMFSSKLFPDSVSEFWISGNSERLKVHVLVKNINVSNSAADKLLALSTSDRLNMDMVDRIKYRIYSSLKNIGSNTEQKLLWSSDNEDISPENLERIILMKTADSINIGTRYNNVHIVAYKKLS